MAGVGDFFFFLLVIFTRGRWPADINSSIRLRAPHQVVTHACGCIAKYGNGNKRKGTFFVAL